MTVIPSRQARELGRGAQWPGSLATLGVALDATDVLASAASDAPVYLMVQARVARYDFSYRTKPGEWTTLAKDVDGTLLSTKPAGGLIGNLFGLHAYANARRR
jgi:beta-xylosidase